MKLLKLTCLIFLFTIQSLVAQEDNIKFEQVHSREGLSHGNVTCILQDRQGFMWFGTWNGLNRFDGYSMKVYRHISSNPGSISDNLILSIYEDALGAIWVGAFDGGLNKYDRATDSFTSYKHNPEDTYSIPGNQVSCIFEDNSGVLWMGILNKLVWFNENDRKFITVKEIMSEALIYKIIESPEDILWIGTFGDGLYKYNKNANTFNRYTNNTLNENGLSYNFICAICQENDKKLWIGTYGGGLDLFDMEKETFTHFKHGKENPNSIAEDKILSLCKDYKGNLWIGTDNSGVDKYCPKENKFIHYNKKDNSTSGISHNSIKAIYESRDKIIWMGTYGEGVNKYNNHNKQFIHYQYDPNNPNSINGNQVKAIFEDNYGILWITVYEGGVNKIDRKNNTNRVYKHNPNDPHSINSNSIWAIIEDRFGELWFGTANGLCKFNRKTDQFTRHLYKKNIPDIKGINIWKLYEDKSGDFWLGTMGKGLYKFNRSSGEYVIYKNIPDDNTSLINNNILSLHEDNQGLFWIGTDEGLEIFNRKTETFTHFVNDPENPESISDNDVISICEDFQGSLWFGTEGGGVDLLNRERMSFINYNENNGLANNVVLAIIEENASEKKETKNLWISTHHGISQFDPINKTFRNYDADDGLQSNGFSINSYYKSGGGEIFFGGYNGFTAFYPDSIKDDMTVPEVVITELKIFNIPVKVGQKINNNIILTKAIEETVKITLTHKESLFSLDFSALHYPAPEKNKYAYFLQGFNDNWIYTDAGRRFATFTNLDPGTYLFKVKASNNDGIWNEEGTSLEIRILPPFWKTIWFRIVAVVIFFLSIYVWYLRRINTIKWQKTTLEQQVKERTHEILEKNEEMKQQKEEIAAQRDALEEANATKDKFFSIISHDLKSPFNALLGFSEVLAESNQVLTKDKIQKFSSQILSSAKQLFSLVENLLAWSRSKTGKIKNAPEKIYLDRLVEETVFILTITALQKSISIKTSFTGNLYVFTDENITLTILRNLVSNAIKYSYPLSTVHISCTEKENFVETSVADTGIGIEENDIKKLFREDIHFTKTGTDREKGTGLGLILCKEFVEMNGGKIWVESEPGKGSVFTFTLPKANT